VKETRNLDFSMVAFHAKWVGKSKGYSEAIGHVSVTIPSLVYRDLRLSLATRNVDDHDLMKPQDQGYFNVLESSHPNATERCTFSNGNPVEKCDPLVDTFADQWIRQDFAAI
jgi:hypothetical protein